MNKSNLMLWNPHYLYSNYYFSEDGRCRKGNKFLFGTLHPRGNRRLSVWLDGNQKKVWFHRVVFETFYGPIPDDLIVMHYDEMLPYPYRDGTDNLFLGTHQLNAIDRENKKRVSEHRGGVSFGERNGNTKLTTDNVIFIRTSSLSKKELAELFSVSIGTIDNIISNRTWSNVAV
jgi:hypothetical protein